MQIEDYAPLLEAAAGHALDDHGHAVAEQMPAVVHYGITTPARLAHFLAQTAHESGGFHWLTEIASGSAYEGRADLGNIEPGDGVRFKGRGLLQITGRANYAKVGAELGLDLVGKPEIAAEPDVAVETAGVFWRDHGLNELADADDIVRITKRINGGLNGFASRKAALARVRAALVALPTAPEPVPAAPQPTAPVIAATRPASLPAAATPPSVPDLPSVERNLAGSAIRHALTGVGFLAPFVGSMSRAELDQIVGWLTGLLFVGAPMLWAWWRARAHRVAVAKALATPAPGQTISVLSDADVQRIAAAVAARPQA